MLIISDNVTGIGLGTFSNCETLKNIIIPNSVIRIFFSAFEVCSNLSNVIFENVSDWYVTTNFTDYMGMDLINPSINATNLRSTYSSYYWRKF